MMDNDCRIFLCKVDLIMDDSLDYLLGVMSDTKTYHFPVSQNSPKIQALIILEEIPGDYYPAGAWPMLVGRR